jgi:NAD(P)H dehydrogenase (quinone)
MKKDASRHARILVLYYSKGGHTKLMADLVAEGAANVPETNVRFKSVAEASAGDLEWWMVSP